MSDLAVPCRVVLLMPVSCTVYVYRRYTEQLAEGFLELEADLERRGLPDGYYMCLVKARLKETPSLESDVIGTVGE